MLGATEAARAHSTVHEGAIYMHLGRSYEVRELDLERRRALVAPFDGDWYTQPKRATDTEIVRLLDRREALGVTLSFGEVSVTETVLAYQRRRLADHAAARPASRSTCRPPASPRRRCGSSSTPASWREIPLEALLGALHATEHAQIAVLPLIAMCDRWDIGGLSTNYHPQTGVPTIFIYDGHPGGIGIARCAFERFEELCDDARRLIAGCPCASGCPSCVQSPKCGNLNEPLSKAGALAAVERLLAAGDPPSREAPATAAGRALIAPRRTRASLLKAWPCARAPAAPLAALQSARRAGAPSAPRAGAAASHVGGPGGRTALTRWTCAKTRRPPGSRAAGSAAASPARRARARTRRPRRTSKGARAKPTTRARSPGTARTSRARRRPLRVQLRLGQLTARAFVDGRALG